MRMHLYFNVSLLLLLSTITAMAMNDLQVPISDWHKKIHVYDEENGKLLDEQFAPLDYAPIWKMGNRYRVNSADGAPHIIMIDKVWYMVPSSLDDYLKSGGNINAIDDRGESMVMANMLSHDYDSVKLLISKGAFPNPRLNRGPGSSYLLAMSRRDYDMAYYIKEQAKLYEKNKGALAECSKSAVLPMPRTTAELLKKAIPMKAALQGESRTVSPLSI